LNRSATVTKRWRNFLKTPSRGLRGRRREERHLEPNEQSSHCSGKKWRHPTGSSQKARKCVPKLRQFTKSNHEKDNEKKKEEKNKRNSQDAQVKKGSKRQLPQDLNGRGSSSTEEGLWGNGEVQQEVLGKGGRSVRETCRRDQKKR